MSVAQSLHLERFEPSALLAQVGPAARRLSVCSELNTGETIAKRC